MSTVATSAQVIVRMRNHQLRGAGPPHIHALVADGLFLREPPPPKAAAPATSHQPAPLSLSLSAFPPFGYGNLQALNLTEHQMLPSTKPQPFGYGNMGGPSHPQKCQYPSTKPQPFGYGNGMGRTLCGCAEFRTVLRAVVRFCCPHNGSRRGVGCKTLVLALLWRASASGVLAGT